MGNDSELEADLGPILCVDDAPELFREIRLVARHAGNVFPTEVRLSYLPAFGVIDRGEKLGRRQLVLIIGLPCLLVLSVGELRSVLGHELAHLYMDDASFTQDVVGKLAALHEPARKGCCPFLARVWRQYVGGALLALAVPVCKLMEFRADRWSASRFGSRSLRMALRRLSAAEPIYRETLAAFDPIKQSRDTVFDFFDRAWGRLATAFLHRDRSSMELPAIGNWRDPHPPLADRLRELRHNPVERKVKKSDRRPALELLADLPAWKTVLHNRLFGHHECPSSVFEPISSSR